MSVTGIVAGSYISIYAAGMNVNVYVSDSTNGPWQSIGNLAIGPLPMAWHSIQSSHSFSYVKISATSTSGISNLYADCLLTM